jgi:hypothetical protein
MKKIFFERFRKFGIYEYLSDLKMPGIEWEHRGELAASEEWRSNKSSIIKF